MTKTIKVILIILGFFVLMGIKLVFRVGGSEGGILWAIFLMGYLAYAGAIWNYKKGNEDSDKLDKKY